MAEPQIAPAHGQWIPDTSTTDAYTLAHRAHYVFSPVEAPKLDARLYSLREIRKRRIELIKTKSYGERSVNDDVMEGSATYLEETANPAAGQAESLHQLYSETGFIIIRSLLGAPEGIKLWVESVLLDGDFQSIIAFQRHLTSRHLYEKMNKADAPQSLAIQFQMWRQALNIANLRELVVEVRKELESSAAMGETWLRSYTGEYLMEMQNAARTGKQGISVVRFKMRVACAELEIDPPDDMQAKIEQMRKDKAGPQQIVASQPGDGIERKQCPRCFNPVPLMDGQLPTYCTFCQANPRELAAADSEPAEPVETMKDALSEGGLGERHTFSRDNPFEDAAPHSGETASGTLAQKTEGVFGGVKCGAPKGGGGTCGNNAGLGTDHPGTGRCHLHPEEGA
ncbi:MAG: hypothetical protein WBV94_21755 [Blastocatellia bacterium]